MAEQSRIVAEVERRLSVADELKKVVDASLRRAERLRQAILKRASRRTSCSRGSRLRGLRVSLSAAARPAARLVRRFVGGLPSDGRGSVDGFARLGREPRDTAPIAR